MGCSAVCSEAPGNRGLSAFFATDPGELMENKDRRTGEQIMLNSLKQSRATRQGFESTTMPHLKALARFALHLVNDTNCADGLVQRTYKTAYQEWGSFNQTRVDDTLSPRLRLFKIMMSEYHRIQNIGRELVPSDNDDQVSAADESSAALEQALSSLSDERRPVVALSLLGGFACREIASIEELPLNTIKARLAAGRLELRQMLSKHLDLSHDVIPATG